MQPKKWILKRVGFPGEIVFQEQKDYSIGRAKGSDYVLLSLFVSRTHCIFKHDGTNLSVMDLNSANGTFVNENRIKAHEAVSLNEKDVIGFGVTSTPAEEFYVYELTKTNHEFAIHIKSERERNDEVNVEDNLEKSTVKQEVSDNEVISSEINCGSIEVIILSDEENELFVGSSSAVLNTHLNEDQELLIKNDKSSCSPISESSEIKQKIKIEPGTSSSISDTKNLNGDDPNRSSKWFRYQLLPYLDQLGSDASDTETVSRREDEKRKSTSTVKDEMPSPKKLKLCDSNVSRERQPISEREPIVLIEKLDETAYNKNNFAEGIASSAEKMDDDKNKDDLVDDVGSDADEYESDPSHIREFLNYSQSDDAVLIIDSDEEDGNEMAGNSVAKECKVEDVFIKEELFDDELEEKDEDEDGDEEDDDLVIMWASKLSQTLDCTNDESILNFSENTRNRLNFLDDSSDESGHDKCPVSNSINSKMSPIICDLMYDNNDGCEVDSVCHKPMNTFDELLKENYFKNSEEKVQKPLLVYSNKDTVLHSSTDSRHSSTDSRDVSPRDGEQIDQRKSINVSPIDTEEIIDIRPSEESEDFSVQSVASSSVLPQSCSTAFPTICSTVPLDIGKDSSTSSKADICSESHSTQSNESSEFSAKNSLNKRTLLCSALPLNRRRHSKPVPDKVGKIKSSKSLSDDSRKKSSVLRASKTSSSSKKLNENVIHGVEREVANEKEKRKIKLKALAEKDKEKIVKTREKPQSSKTSQAVKNTKSSRADKLAELFVSPQQQNQSESLHNKTKHVKGNKKSTNTCSEKSDKARLNLISKPSNRDKVSHSSHSIQEVVAVNVQSETEVIQKIKKLSFKDLPKIPKLKVPDKVITQTDSLSAPPKIHDNSKDRNQDKVRDILPRRSKQLRSILSTVNKSSKKKKVSFAPEESLYSIRIFPVTFDKSLRRVDVKDIPARRVDVEDARSLFEVSTNTLESIISKILCSWNPRWLQEQKEVSKYGDVPPPCYGTNEPVSSLVPMLTSFSNYEEYVKILHPLMFLDLWAEVSENADRPTDRSRIKFNLTVDDLKPAKGFTILSCSMPLEVRNEQEKNFPRVGDLCYIYCPYVCSAQPSARERSLEHGKSIERRWAGFAYVDTVLRDRFQKGMNLNQGKSVYTPRYAMTTREYSQDDGPYSCVLKLTIKLKSGNHIPFQNQSVKLQIITNIRPTLRTFEAVAYLEHTKLSKMILKPQVEDYTLPAVNKDTKIWDEDLLDQSQKIAVLKASRVCLDPDSKICLIQGPPGTGKTKVILNIIMQILYPNNNISATENGRIRPKILLCAPSNAGVDEIVGRLLQIRYKMKRGERFKMVRCGQYGSTRESIRGVSLETLVEKDMNRTLNFYQNSTLESVQLEIANLQARKQSYLMTLESAIAKGEETEMHQRKIKDTERKISDLKSSKGSGKKSNAMEKESKKKILAHADIVATTLTSSNSASLAEVFASKYGNSVKFSCCIIDEATQCNEPECLIPFMYNIDKIVMVGDPEQLPATVLSRVAREKGFGQPLFNRIWHVFQHQPDNPVIFLYKQFRMHPDIYHWPNKYIYQGRVKSDSSVCRSWPLKPYFVFSLSFNQTSGHSILNEKEAIFVSKMALAIERTLPNVVKTIGIITPYQKQLTKIKYFISKNTTSSIIVNTIDGFQGQECDIVIFSCVRSQGLGFLGESQRLNVAITRARVSLIICGNFMSLKEDNMWSSLLNDAANRGVLIHTGTKELSEDEILNYIMKS